MQSSLSYTETLKPAFCVGRYIVVAENRWSLGSCLCGQEQGRGKEEAEEIRAHPAAPTSFLKIQTRLRACCGFNLGTPGAAASRRTGLALLLLMAG
jgi:hypothetical protein